VGYGDKYPVLPGGRGVAVVLMLAGIGLIGVLTATVASYFTEEKTDQEKAELSQRLDRIEAIRVIREAGTLCEFYLPATTISRSYYLF